GTVAVEGSAATAITLTDLDLNSDEHYYVVFMAKNALWSVVNINLYYNSDLTDSNYYIQYVSGNGGSVSGGRYNVPQIAGMESSEGVCGTIQITKGYDDKPSAISHTNRGRPTGGLMQTFAHSWV